MKTQDVVLYALVLFVLWLLFMRKTEGCCGMMVA